MVVAEVNPLVEVIEGFLVSYYSPTYWWDRRPRRRSARLSNSLESVTWSVTGRPYPRAACGECCCRWAGFSPWNRCRWSPKWVIYYAEALFELVVDEAHEDGSLAGGLLAEENHLDFAFYLRERSLGFFLVHLFKCHYHRFESYNYESLHSQTI